MKITQGSVYLLIAILLGACTVRSRGTAIPATASPTLPPPTATATRPPSTATSTPTPSPTLTPTAVVTPLCPAASSPGDWECREYADGGGRVRARTCAPAPLSAAEWLCYENLDYGFALEYPASLKYSTRFRYDKPRPKDLAGQVASYEFLGTAGAPRSFWLDIWLSSEPDLTSWLEKVGRSTVDLPPVVEPNAMVGGRPAIAFAENPETAPSRITVFFRDGAYVYRLWRWGACYRQGERQVNELPIVRRVLDSIRFSPEPVPAQIPDDVWQQALRKCTPKDRIGR